jgi:hypothetical protein
VLAAVDGDALDRAIGAYLADRNSAGTACGLQQVTLLNESWEHHMLKLEMAGAIRAAGWFAAPELPAEDGSWRADVMASSADGSQRMAWEAQLSPITVDDIVARTDRYAGEAIRVCWVHPGAAAAVDQRGAGHPSQGSAGAGSAVDGGRRACGVRVPERAVGGPGRAARAVRALGAGRWALEEQLIPAKVLPGYRRVYRVVDGEQRRFRRDRWWTSRKSIADQGRHEVAA